MKQMSNYRKYTGVAMDKERIIAITGHKEDHCVAIESMWEGTRTGTYIEDMSAIPSDCMARYGAVVCDVPTYGYFTEVPTTDGFTISTAMLKVNYHKMYHIDMDDYVLDKVMRSTPAGKRYLYSRAMPKEELMGLKEVVRKHPSWFGVIDYWPAPATYIHLYRNGLVQGIVKGEQVHLWGWWNGASVGEMAVPATGVAVQQGLENLRETFHALGHDNIEGFICYGKQLLSEEAMYDMMALEESYPLMHYVPFQYDAPMTPVEEDDDLLRHMAVGLLVRCTGSPWNAW